jgi:hypothetical protein
VLPCPVVRRILRSHAGRFGASRAGVGPRFVAALLFSGLLPGCPLSDAYFVDPNATQGSGGVGADHGGTAGMAGVVSNGGKGARESGGSGGRAGPGPKGDAGSMAPPALGGTGGSSPACDAPERCDGLDNDCDDQIDEDSVCPASCSAQQHDGHAYVLCVATEASDALTAEDAAAECAALGNDPPFRLELAWIESSGENDFLQQWIEGTAPSDGVVWMGASDQMMEGTWVWGRRPDAQHFFMSSDRGGGSPVMDRFNDFGEGQPGSTRGLDEDCGAFDARVAWHWSDRECTEAMVGFVCEQHP